MKITKLGHCCLLIEEQGVRILTDPGNYSTAQDELKNIDLILITHEHQDHFHLASLKLVRQNNPAAKIVTNAAVGALLAKENIPFSLLADGQKATERRIKLEGFGREHALMHAALPLVQNTGYFIAERLFYPGDAFTNPNRAVEILALPVAGPWMKLSEAIDYALALKPKLCSPVPDAILKAPGPVHFRPPQVLTPAGIEFQVFELGKEYEV